MALFVPLLLGAVSGCGGSNVDPYPARLVYPARTDLIVKDIPGDEVFTPDDPGQLERHIAAINSKPPGKTVDPTQVPEGTRQKLEAELQKIFGKPASPTVIPTDDDQKELVANLQLDETILAEGSKNYRRHCMHCHGVPGDGRGPTGPWLNPHPRDYRQGIFKFNSTKGDSALRKPRRDDLLRTLRKGVDGTSMPSFGLEAPEVLNSLASYVIHLSMRGEVEMRLLEALFSGQVKEGGIAEEIDRVLGKVLKGESSSVPGWATATVANEPDAYPYTDQDFEDSVSRGYKAFINDKTFNCIKCHIDFGRQSLFRYDSWGTMVRPRDLTVGIYRGGRRPVDIYWRLKGGIPGSGMPAPPPGKRDAKTDETWDVVNFVLALPYPKMLPDEVRAKVYPEPKEHATEKHAAAD
jgi:mono/diheme cytochrome c family protein